MCHWQLGQRDLAEQFREQFDEALKSPLFSADKDVLSAAGEIDELFGESTGDSSVPGAP